MGLAFDSSGWLTGLARGLPVRKRPTVRTMPLDGKLAGIVWHWTAGYGSCATLGRLYEKGPIGEPSFHVGIDPDGSCTQLVPLILGSNHCRGRLPDGRYVNACTFGVELVNVGRVMQDAAGTWRQVENPHEPASRHVPNMKFAVPPQDVVQAHGGAWHRFTEAQVSTAQALCDALASAGVPMRHWGHVDLDPARKADPGPVWMRDVVGSGRLLALSS